MKRFTDSIRHSLQEKNWFAALFMALSLPDICGKVENPKSKIIREHYCKWFNENLKELSGPENVYESIKRSTPGLIAELRPEEIASYKAKKLDAFFTAEFCWALRNAMLHEASDITKKGKVHLTPTMSSFNKFDDELQIGVPFLCEEICKAVEKWEQKVRQIPEVANRIDERSKITTELFGGRVRFE